MFGCNNNTNSNSIIINDTGLSGEELAKLLLADERLDSDTLKDSSAILNAQTASNYIFSSEFINCLKVPVNYSQGTCTVNGNTYEWSNFTDFCNIDSFFDSYGTASGIVEQLNEDGTYGEYNLSDVPADCTLRMAYTYDDNGTETTAYCTLILVSE